MYSEERRNNIRAGVIRDLIAKGKYVASLEPRACPCGEIFRPDCKKQRYCKPTCRPAAMSRDQKKKNVYIAVQKRRKKLKAMAVASMGGKCQRCGYDRCIEAMEFHHIDPAAKDFQISTSLSWKKIETEIKKCLLLCANCHREEHVRIFTGVSPSPA